MAYFGHKDNLFVKVQYLFQSLVIGIMGNETMIVGFIGLGMMGGMPPLTSSAQGLTWSYMIFGPTQWLRL